MKPANFTISQQRLLDRFFAAHGVVEFFLFDGEEHLPDESQHRTAVSSALKLLQQKQDNFAEQMSAEHGIPKERCFQFEIDSQAAQVITPRTITWREFLGSRYDFERQGLIVRGKGDFLNEFFFYRDQAVHKNIIPADRIDHGIGTGFAYAFSSPPYNMQMPAEELGKLFSKFLRFLIEASDHSLIFEWPTDWSNYFDAGHEWWGSFLWSISNPGSTRILVIVASTTD